MKKNENIPFKNYIILSIVLILSIIGVVYFYMWYDELKDNSINTNVMNRYLNVINYNEIDNYLVENKSCILYVSSAENIDIRKFENKFKKVVNKYALNSKILYLDLTDDSSNSAADIIMKYHLKGIPCIIIFEEGKISDIYYIKDYNYDIELLVSYLKIKGVIYD